MEAESDFNIKKVATKKKKRRKKVGTDLIAVNEYCSATLSFRQAFSRIQGLYAEVGVKLDCL
jgi:hypothetical protein